MNNTQLINKLKKHGKLDHAEYISLFSTYTNEDLEYARSHGREITKQHFGNKIYIRGLIEFTNICKNNCLYCGLRCSNTNIDRYRLTDEEIMSCAEYGYGAGFRTFVLQGGEDTYFNDDKICNIVKSLKTHFPDCAVTLSIGERPKRSYQAFFDAGADRFLLRHETANHEHYQSLHPKGMTLENRMNCLSDLKEIGFQTGCGFMVGSPYQSFETLADDMVFIQNFKPHMVGIGPFIPHSDTPFKDKPQGSLELTLFCLALVRIMLKKVLLPATTALGTITQSGREMGILSGANVVMPNLSPEYARERYMLYNNKLSSGCEALDGINKLNLQLENIGYTITVDRGDYNFK